MKCKNLRKTYRSTTTHLTHTLVCVCVHIFDLIPTTNYLKITVINKTHRTGIHYLLRRRTIESMCIIQIKLCV